MTENSQDSAREPRSRVLGGCVAAAELIALALTFAALGLHGGLWALPAFAPALAWMLGCGVAGRTLRPAALAQLRGGGRLTAAALALAVFLLLWSSWSGAALAAWHGHHGGFGGFGAGGLGAVGGTSGFSAGSAGGGGAVSAAPSLDGFPASGGGGGISLPSLPDPFPRLPYGSVIGASPVLLALVWLALVALAMIAMPGRRGAQPLPSADFDAGIVPAYVELANERGQR